ncbi:hypothetical protein ACWFR5_28815 [Streptomyces sp. NPDC055092]|uniref:hypothetical protein n=1 Tax=Streptomyces sp. NPDC059262 TaxID=3346797 RepID=UPI00368F4C55
MKPKVGQTLASTVDATTVIVIRAPEVEVSLTCGGAEMADAKAVEGVTGSPDPAQMEGTRLGKRYADDDLGIELLVTKSGQGTLAVNGALLGIKGAKPLPASD